MAHTLHDKSHRLLSTHRSDTQNENEKNKMLVKTIASFDGASRNQIPNSDQTRD